MLIYGGHFLESDGIVNGNSRRSDMNPENDQSFPELRLSSAREFPGSIQCIPDIWLSFHGAPAFRLRLHEAGVWFPAATSLVGLRRRPLPAVRLKTCPEGY
jgi:hypothetical protein